MKQHYRKLLSLVLVMAMALSLVSTSFAAVPAASTANTKNAKASAALSAQVHAAHQEEAPAEAEEEEEVFPEMDLTAEAAEAPVVEVTAPEAPAPALPAAETPVLRTQAASNGWTVSKDQKTLTFYYTDTVKNALTQAKNGFYAISADSTAGGLTIKAGIYHFDKNGALNLSASQADAQCKAENLLMIEVQDGTFVGDSARVESRVLSGTAPATLSNNVVTGHLSLFSGVYGEKTYCKGVLFTGYHCDSDGRYYVYEVGVRQNMLNGTVPNAAAYDSAWKAVNVNGKAFYDGKLFTGLYRADAGAALIAYENGSQTKNFSGTVSASAVVLDQNWTPVTGVAGLTYLDGALFTGFYRASASSALVSYSNGVSNGKYSGEVAANTKIYNSSWVASVDPGTLYYNGTAFSGYYKNSKGVLYSYSKGKTSAPFSGKLAKKAKIYNTSFTATTTTADAYYFNGTPYTGYFRLNSSSKVQLMKDGVSKGDYTGYMKSQSGYSTYIVDYKKTTLDKLYYEAGAALTGVPSAKPTLGESAPLSYFKSGKLQKVTGWKKIGEKFYYFNSQGTAVTGEQRLTTYGAKDGESKSKKYTYYFKNDGSMVTNLFAYNTAFKSKKIQIVVSRQTHTGTILVWNSKTNAYDIAAKSFVFSTSKLASDYKPGNYKLRYRSMWFMFVQANGREDWFQYAMYVWGSGALIHSSNYTTKGDVNSLIPSRYNKLGTNSTFHCYRLQTVNSKLIWDIGKVHGVDDSKFVKDIIFKSTLSDKTMPFGKMTITNNTDYSGKVSGKQKFDPTDPKCKGQKVYLAK